MSQNLSQAQGEPRSRPSSSSSTAQQPYSCQPSYQPPESHLAVTTVQVGEGPDRRGQESRLDADLVRIAAADGIFGLDAYTMNPETDKAAALPGEDLAPLIVHVDQVQLTPPGGYQMKNADAGFDLLSIVELLRPPVRAGEAAHAARAVAEGVIVPGEHAPRVVRRRGELGVYLRDYDKTSRRPRKSEGAVGDVGWETKRPLFRAGASADRAAGFPVRREP